jgi:hypothetical protein
MTTRRFLYVDPDLTVPPSPTGLPEGYAVINQDGHLFVIKGGAFKAANAPGTIVASGLPPYTGAPVQTGDAPVSGMFNDTTGVKPSAWQADNNNDASQTYSNTTAPTPPTGGVGYTAITPRGGYPAAQHYLNLATDTRLTRGAYVSFKYRFDVPNPDDKSKVGLALRVSPAYGDFYGITLFKATSDGGNVGGNFDAWKDATFYLPPGSGVGQILLVQTQDSYDSGGNSLSDLGGRILITEFLVTPFDVMDQGTNWYDDRTGYTYVYDLGWRWLADPITLKASQKSYGSFFGGTSRTLSSDEILVFAPGPVAAPSLNVPTPQAGGSLEESVAVYYKVTSVNQHGESLPSTEMTASTDTTNRAMSLSWAAVPNALGYNVYAGYAAGVEVLIAHLDKDSLTYTDAGGGRTTIAPPSTDTTSDPAMLTVPVPGMINTQNTYNEYGDPGDSDFTDNTFFTAALSVKHDAATPDITVTIERFNHANGVTEVLASITAEDMITSKYRNFSLSTFVRGYSSDPGTYDFFVKVSTAVDGTVTVKQGSSYALSEIFQ